MNGLAALPPAASPEGTLYRVGSGFYPTISAALAAVIADRGTAEFTSPAVIQLEPGTHAEPTVLEAQGLHTTLANPLIIQGRPGTVATLTGQVIVASAPTNMIWRGLVIGGTLSHFSVNDPAVTSCIVTGKLFFFYCERASVVGNTFKAPTTAAPLSMMFSMDVLVRDNIFLVDSNNGAAIEELLESSADSDYNIYWPSNTLSRAEVHGIYTNPGLDAVTFEITSTNSPAFQSGVALPGFGTDFAGVQRHPLKPCRGAVELVPDDNSLTAGDIRDKGGRLIRRKVQDRIQNLGYDGRNRLTRWDWDGSAGTSCTYDYDHAGRRILTRETVGGATKVTRYVYDGADVCAEYEDSDDDGDVDRTRVYWLLPGMDRRIGFAENVNGTNTFYYYLTDQVGTVLRIVKEDGTVVNQYDYDAFGRVRWASANTWEQPGLENRYLFQGREWDKNGGFYYFRNRIYLPERGEFSSPDMNLGRGILGELDGMATLTFCGGDPVNMIDPDGLRPKLTTWLRSGGTYWDVNDMPDNVRASVYATDYDKDGVISTRAGTHALIGILGVFEGAALMGWDIGEGLSGSENIGEENMIAGMINLGMDEGVGTLGKEMVLAPFKAIASGDAEQFGTGMFGLYIVGRQSLAQGNGYLNARNSGMGRWDALKTGLRTQPEGLRFKSSTKTVAPASEPVVISETSPAGAGGAGESGVYEIRGTLDGKPTGYAGSAKDMAKRLSDPKHPARILMDEGKDVSIIKRRVDVSDAASTPEAQRILRTSEQLSIDELRAEGLEMLNKIRARATKKFGPDLTKYGDRRQ